MFYFAALFSGRDVQTACFTPDGHWLNFIQLIFCNIVFLCFCTAVSMLSQTADFLKITLYFWLEIPWKYNTLWQVSTKCVKKLLRNPKAYCYMKNLVLKLYWVNFVLKFIYIHRVSRKEEKICRLNRQAVLFVQWVWESYF